MSPLDLWFLGKAFHWVLTKVGLVTSWALGSIREWHGTNKALKKGSRELLDAAPSAVPLLKIRLPSLFERETPQGDEPPPQLSQSELLKELRTHGQIVLYGEAGAGKTTALLGLGREMLAAPHLPRPIYFDAAVWASKGVAIIDYLESLGPFKRAPLTGKQLSAFIAKGRIALLINGWNEIQEKSQANANSLFEDFLAGHGNAIIIMSSRTKDDIPQLSNAFYAKVSPFFWERQQDLVRMILVREKATSLLERLSTDSTFRVAARNPLLLAGVIFLQQEGKEIPGTMFEVLAAVVVAFEAVPHRRAVLRASPVHSHHQRYLQALAWQMNCRGSTELTQSEARQAIGMAVEELRKTAELGAGVQADEILHELCNQHLLYAEKSAGDIRFSHQRFQELYGAYEVLARIELLPTGRGDDDDLVRTVFNHPFWEDSIRLCAEKMSTNRPGDVSRVAIINLALRVDLLLASGIGGTMRIGDGDRPAFEQLLGQIESFYRVPNQMAKRYALACMALTQSTAFADHFLELFENQERKEFATLLNNLHEIPISCFGPSWRERFNSWESNARLRFLDSLSADSQNLGALEDIARTDPADAVRAKAIAILAWSFPASTAAVRAWLEAPDSVKIEHSALQAIENEPDERYVQQLASEVRRISQAPGRRNILFSLAIDRPSTITADTVRAALEELVKPEWQGREEPLLRIINAHDKDALMPLAVEKLVGTRETAAWVENAIAGLSKRAKTQAFESAWARLQKSPSVDVDASAVGPLANGGQVKLLLSELLRLRAERKRGQDALEHTIEQLLYFVETDSLVAAVLSRKREESYAVVEKMLSLLLTNLHLQSVEQARFKETKRLLKWQCDSLLSAFWDCKDPEEIPVHAVKAHLCVLMSQVNPLVYMDHIVQGLLLEVERSRVRRTTVHRGRVQNATSWDHEFLNAAVACGFSILPELFPHLEEPEDRDILTETIGRILWAPWAEISPLQHWPSLDLKARAARLRLGKVKQQPEEKFQNETDAFGRLVAKRLEEQLAQVPIERRDQFFRGWVLALQLARLPSTAGESVAFRVLKMPEMADRTFIPALNGLVSQGAKIDDLELIQALVRHFRERVSTTKWFGQDDTSLQDLAALHFFIEHPSFGDNELREVVETWLTKEAQTYVVVRKLKDLAVEGKNPAATRALVQVAKSREGHFIDETIGALVGAAGGAEALFQLALEGRLFQLEIGHSAGRVASALTSLLQRDDAKLQEFFLACGRSDSTNAEYLSCAVAEGLGASNRIATEHLLRYISGEQKASPRNGAAGTLALLFEKRSVTLDPGKPMPPRAETHDWLKERLFEIAVSGRSGAWRACMSLMMIEERRYVIGRPALERRHPRIDSRLPWPGALATGLGLVPDAF